MLEEDGAVVAESTAILEYLEERYPERPLYPLGEARRTELRLFVDWFNRVWKVPPNEIEAELGKPAPNDARIEELGAQMRAWLDWFERLLDGREYLLGEFSAADCAAYPFLKYARSRPEADDERFHVVLEEHQPLTGHPRLEAWLERMAGRPGAS